MLDYGQIMQAGMSLVPNLEAQLRVRAETERMQALTAQAKQDMDFALANNQREEDYAREAVEVFQNPTRENIAALEARYPQHAKAIRSIWDARAEAQRQEEVTHLGSLFALLRGGQIERAAQKARARYQVDLDAGQAEDIDLAIVEMLESGNPEAISKVGGMLTILLSAAVGPDKMGATYQNLGEESRQQDTHGSRVAKAESEAITAEAEAKAAPNYYRARSDHEAAEADIAESDARYRDRKNASEIAGRDARTQATRGREGRAASGGTASSRAAPRPKYVQYARDAKGNRIGFNAKTRKWEKVR